MRRTNYAGVTPEMLDMLYRQVYLERLTGKQRLRMVTKVDITGAQLDESDGDVVLTLTDRMTGVGEELRCDMVMLGTGFEPKVPHVVRAVADAVGVEEISVSRHYRMTLPPGVTASCYLQGTNEDSHGMADSLMSVLAVRAGEIVNDLLAHRPVPELATATLPAPELPTTNLLSVVASA
jgi:L-ornithine N5-oxygenase